MTEKKKFFILDGYALAYRAYFAFIRSPLTNSRGKNTSAAYGFALALLKILNEENPDYIGVAFDSSGPTFRHDLYSDYKATRQKMPDDLRYQIPWIKSILKALNIPTYEKPGYEADDIVGTLAMKARKKGLAVYLATGDKDFTQLVGNDIFFYNIRTKDVDDTDRVMNAEEVVEYMGVPPEQVTDLLALEGDTSDNIPGVPKVGRKTAIKLLKEYGSLDKILASAEEIKGKLGENIRENKDIALLSRDLARIKKDLEIEVDIEDFRKEKPDETGLFDILTELEFHSLIERFSEGKKLGKYDREKQDYLAITDRKELEEYIKILVKQKFVVFDIESTSCEAVDAEMIGISFAWKEGESRYIPVKAAEGDIFDISFLLNLLKPLMEDDSIRKGGQNLKYDISILKRYGIKVKGIDFDTLIASYLLSPEARRHNLDSIALEYLNYKKIPTTKLIGTGKKQKSMAVVPLEDITRYCCEDSDITLRLRNVMKDTLQGKNLIKLFEEIEMPLVDVLSDMELTGVKIDVEHLSKMSDELGRDLESLTGEIYDMADTEFNIDSPQQLGTVLFDKLEIQKEMGGKRVRRTKIGYSTDARTLNQFCDHPLVAKILEYRHLRKLKSTYIDALPDLINKRTGRIHTSYNQTITATGRLSSSNPNLQNIPIRTEVGKRIRRAFIPTEETRVILSADYSQIEFRIAADFSKDKRIIDAFRQDADIHRRTAALIYDIPDEEVSPQQRSRAKEISFGILYGMNQYGLASRLKISNEEAEEFMRTYFAMLPGIGEYIQRQLKDAREKGYVQTLYGRRRPVANIESDNARLRSLAEHIAINTPIQGTAADIIKIAMIKIYNELERKNLKTRMIMQVHDELIFDTPENELGDVKKIVKSNMENAAELSVPLKVDIGIGKNWLETHKFNKVDRDEEDFTDSLLA